MAHQCPLCGMRFESKAWAKKCEAWCNAHKSCNIDIIKHALQ